MGVATLFLELCGGPIKRLAGKVVRGRLHPGQAVYLHEHRPGGGHGGKNGRELPPRQQKAGLLTLELL